MMSPTPYPPHRCLDGSTLAEFLAIASGRHPWTWEPLDPARARGSQSS
jgi:hypothetical protein